MHHEPTPILYLNEKLDPVLTQTIDHLKEILQLSHLTDNTDLDKFLHNHPYFILIANKSNIEQFIEYSPKNKLKNLLDHFVVIALGDEGFDLIGSEKLNSFRPLINVISYPLNNKQVTLALLNAQKYLFNKISVFNLQQKLKMQTKEMRELNDIGIALSAERDPDILLEMILVQSRKITRADAGSLYLVEKRDGVEEDEINYFADKQLRFKLAQNDTLHIGFTESVMPIEKKSIAGHVALSGQNLNVPDVYQLPDDAEFKHNRSFDESVGYRTKSMLVIPMKNHQDEIIGVLQLINRKKNWDARLTTEEIIKNEIIEFDEHCVELASSLASQAAVSIENSRLYEEIKNLFEGFIKASVHAIEQRDPTTFGHSERVATLTTALAKQVNQLKTGRYKDVKFSRDDIQQINYAALLHDFGKIGVKEDILIKAKKLYPYELEVVKNRFRIFSQATELNYSKEKIGYLLEAERVNSLKQLELLDVKTKQKIHELDEYLKLITEVNEPTIMKKAGFEMLSQIGKIIFKYNGKPANLLTEKEVERLSIPKGSLSNEERKEIESHVTHTFNFLTRIPWTRELKQIPQIAHSHHEKLDGTGYPQGISNEKIPIQAKMMTIADIYDALTAWDRPYKRAVPVEKALDIIQWEVNEGKIDADLFKIFLDAKLYELVKKPENV